MDGREYTWIKKLQKISKEFGSDFTVRDIWIWININQNTKINRRRIFGRHVISDVGRTLDREFVNSKIS